MMQIATRAHALSSYLLSKEGEAVRNASSEVRHALGDLGRVIVRLSLVDLGNLEERLVRVLERVNAGLEVLVL